MELSWIVEAAPRACLPALREAPHASTRTRTHTRKSLQGSRRDCSMQRNVGRHEHRCASLRRKSRGSSGVRPSTISWSSVGRGHYSEVSPDRFGHAPPWSCCCERHCVRKSKSGQGTEVRRAAFWRQVPSRGGGHGNWRKMDGVLKPSNSWTIWRQLEHGKRLLSSNGPRSSLGDGGGRECSPFRAQGLSPTLGY